MRYLLANWKMHTTVGQAVALLARIQEGLRGRAGPGNALPLPIVCPPFVSLVPMRALADPELVRLGAQNCHWEPEGPYTGEVSTPMLADLVDYVLVGHSERRAAGDTDEQIAGKVAAAARAGLTPVLFVGEDERGEDAARRSGERLAQGLSRVDVARQPVLVVYEPAWAIGADQPAEPGYVSDVVEDLKGQLRRLGHPDPHVVYGGTVSEETIEEFADLPVLDGVGATRASLDPDKFLAMVDRLTVSG